MKTISNRTSHIFKEYYKETARDRFAKILKLAIEITDSISAEYNNNISFDIDGHRLAKCIDSYFLDVIRYKEYHCNPEGADDIYSVDWTRSLHSKKLLNKSKVAALTAKWLLKYSPINTIYNTPQQVVHDKVCHVNQYFALHCALYTLLEGEFLRLTKPEIESLFYDFRYRAFDERAYFSRFELLEQLVSVYDTDDLPASDEIIQAKESTPKTTHKKTFRIFIASPSDVKNLRSQTKVAIKEVNKIFKGDAEIEAWAWEDDKNPGHNYSNEDYQEKLIQEAGDYFDVFLILLWSKYGNYTASEYNWYLNTLSKKNKDIEFIPFLYQKNIPRSHVSASTAQLNSWLENVSANWAFLGGGHPIKTPDIYRQALQTALARMVRKKLKEK